MIGAQGLPDRNLALGRQKRRQGIVPFLAVWPVVIAILRSFIGSDRLTARPLA
jgi:hypothetical protein